MDVGEAIVHQYPERLMFDNDEDDDEVDEDDEDDEDEILPQS